MSAPRRVRLIVEVDVEILDDDWTDRDLIDNVPDFVSIMFQEGERRSMQHHGPGPYRLNVDDLSVYLADEYLAEIADAGGLASLAALPPAERRAIWLAEVTT